MTIEVEQELRATFATRAAGVMVVSDPYPATARRITRARRRRAFSGAALAISLVAAVPVGLHLAVQQSPSPSPATAVSGPLTWPTRGSLAGDAAFLKAVRQRTGGGKVAYAGDDGRNRAAVVFVVERRSAKAYVLYGPSGSTASALRKEGLFESADLPLDPRPIVWYSPTKAANAPQILLIIGSPDMRDVRLSPGVTFRPDGTPHRDSIKLRATQGAVLTEVRDLRSPDLKARIGGRDTGLPSTYAFATGLPDTSPGFQAAVEAAARKATGQVDPAEAVNLLHMTAAQLNVAVGKLTYRFWWGGRVAGHTVTIATISAPGTPTFRLVDIWQSDGSRSGGEGDTKGARFTGTPHDSLGWTTGAGLHGSGPATAAVWVPGKPGIRVRFRLGGRTLGERRTDSTALAVLSTTMTENQLSKADYQVVNDHGGVVGRGGLGLDAFDKAVETSDW
ncbi:MAG: hypothetical protein JWN52_2094 [Actinomycetia bacterium]|nr:hypothetical protein [Actinomycetes bacterium]